MNEEGEVGSGKHRPPETKQDSDEQKKKPAKNQQRASSGIGG